MAETNLEKLAREKREREAILELEKKELSYDKLAEFTGMKKELISILHKTVAKNTTPAELAYFLQVCNSSGLNPINKEIWCYKDTLGNLIVFTGRDGFLKKNKENPAYRGMISSEVYEFDEFGINMITGEVRHEISNNRGKKILGAYAIVYIDNQKPTVVWLDFNEFNLGQARWKTAPGMMIKKCAQSHALKEAAGVTGIQAEESWTVRDGIVTADKEITPHEEVVAGKETERLMLMIENAKTPEALEKLLKEVRTPDEIHAYDEKMEKLKTVNA